MSLASFFFNLFIFSCIGSLLQCASFSLQWLLVAEYRQQRYRLQQLQRVDLIIVACGLYSTGSVVMAWGFSYCMALGIFLDQGSNRAPCTGRWILIYCTTREVPSQSFCNTVSPLHMNVFYSKSKFPSPVCLKVQQRQLMYPTNTISHLVLNCESEVTQSCLTLCDPIDRSLPGSSALGIFQARVLEWVAISFSRGSSQPRDQTWVSRIEGRRFLLYCSRFIIVFTQITI